MGAKNINLKDPRLIAINKKHLIMNGKKHKVPGWINTSRYTVMNGRIYVDKYQFVNGRFEKSWKAIWHNYIWTF